MFQLQVDRWRMPNYAFVSSHMSVCFWQEKAPYEAKATKRKGDYQKLMTAYNKKQVSQFISILCIVLVSSIVLVLFICLGWLACSFIFKSIGKHSWRWWWGIWQVKIWNKWWRWRGKWAGIPLDIIYKPSMWNSWVALDFTFNFLLILYLHPKSWMD